MTNKRVVGLVGLVLVMVLAVGLVLLSSGRTQSPTAQAQTTPDTGWNGQGGITVEGTGTVEVKPDQVEVVLGVQTKATGVSEAQKQAADKSQQLTDALKKAGIKDTDIKTTNYSVSPEYIYDNGKAPQLTGYTVSNDLQVTIHDISKAGDILDLAGNSGATMVRGINFTLSNNADALKQARTEAMGDALQKANQFAAAGKVTVGSVVRVSEQSQNVGPQPVQFADSSAGVAAPAAAKTVVQSGQYKVIVNVSVTYTINK